MQMLKIPISTEYIELNQLLKLAGLASSGGGGKALVATGGVMVDGATELRKTAKIRVGQVVTAGDARICVIAGTVGTEHATRGAANAARRPAWPKKTIRRTGK
jgi:ribosome-associated protein